MDFSKAFDTVDHTILCNKLNKYGIRGAALEWMKSYLCDRQQYVFYDDHCSDKKTLKCGVPQGSVLGPLLFILYINDIVNVSTFLLPILFADDTNAIASGNNLDDLVTKINEELEKLKIWLTANKLSLNIKKNTLYVL